MKQKINIRIKDHFFELSESKYKCHLCESFITPQNNNFANLKRHMLAKHKNEISLFLDDKKIFPFMNCEYQNVENSLPKCSFTNFIVNDNRPISMVTSKNFVNFCKFLNPSVKIPTVYNIEQNLDIAENIFTQKIQEFIANPSVYFSLNLDIWAYNNKNILAIKMKSVQENMDFKDITIFFSFIMNQKSSTIVEKFRECQQLYNFSADRPQNICTDNCNSMKKFYKILLEEEMSCDIIESDAEEEVMNSMLEENNFCSKGVKWIGCSIHLLQLVINSAIKKCQDIKDLFDRITDLSKLLKTTKYKNKNIFIPKPNEIKWNSKFRMLEHFINNENNLSNIKGDLGDAFTFKEEEIFLLRHVYKLLKPIYFICKAMEKDFFYFPNFFMWKNKYIRNILNKIKDIKKEGIFTNFAQLISNELILRFADLESDWSDKINIGLFLNPASLKLLDNEVKTDVMRNLQLQMEIQEEPPLNLETDICFDSDDKSSDCLELNSFSVPDIFDQQESRKVKVCTDVKEATSILKQYVKIGIETNFDLISFWKLYSNKFPLLYNKFR